MTETERLAFKEVISRAREITLEELEDLKKYETRRFFIIKYRDALFLSYDVSPLRPYLTSEGHLCAVCRRCIAKPTQYGGCDKVYDIKTKSIDNYRFVRLGVEAFNSQTGEHNFFMVNFCRNFQAEPERKKTGMVCHNKLEPSEKPYYTYTTIPRSAPVRVPTHF